jgi:hypothetical protein
MWNATPLRKEHELYSPKQKRALRRDVFRCGTDPEVGKWPFELLAHDPDMHCLPALQELKCRSYIPDITERVTVLA